MELAPALKGLDAHPWTATSHAYGSAEDLPALLRVLAGPDDAASEALSELYSCVLHQGTVYPASAEVVPFLTRTAAAGIRTAAVLELLGGLAESEDEHGVQPGTVRAAVASQLHLLLTMLSSDDPKVRQRAAWAVAHTRAADPVLTALRARWEREADPLVRADLLAGISRLDPALGAAQARTVLAHTGPAVLHLAALFAILDADLPWTADHSTALLALLPADPLMADRLELTRHEPLSVIVETLLNRDDAADRVAVFALLDTALRDSRPEVRAEALWSAEQACKLSRSAPAQLLPGLVAAAVDDEAVIGMAALLGQLGPAAAAAAPILEPLAARAPEQDDDLADRALDALVRVAPAQAAPLLARAFGRRPRALATAAGGFGGLGDTVVPYDGELLDAVRQRLTQPETLTGNEPLHLTQLLATWGAEAAPALPELCAALPQLPAHAATGLGAVATTAGPAEQDRAATALRAAAAGSLPAARALSELTGEDQTLLSHLTRQLGGGAHQVREAAAIAATLGLRAAPLLPALRTAVSTAADKGGTPVLDADTALAGALWHLTQDAETVVAILDTVLLRAAESTWSGWSAARAARCAVLFGTAGRPLTHRLEAMLEDPRQAPAAALALAAVADPAALDRTALVTAVLTAAERGGDPMGACEALAALETHTLNPHQLRRLTTLAEGDGRVVRSGLEHLIIDQDLAFQARARLLLPA
ncbi:hypothetical protein [Kitasatospora sp. NPDC002040]|uniref:hypothetical protein n=1 Tax=Kitasatospora sp. NPDC002040 TaxID=3154661 RepID=UPI003321B5A7